MSASTIPHKLKFGIRMWFEYVQSTDLLAPLVKMGKGLWHPAFCGTSLCQHNTESSKKNLEIREYRARNLGSLLNRESLHILQGPRYSSAHHNCFQNIKDVLCWHRGDV